MASTGAQGDDRSLLQVCRPFPTTVLWRWRYEAAGTAGGPLLWWTCARAGTGLATMIVVTALLAFGAMVGPVRRWLTSLAWCVVTPHRIRVGCARAGVVSSRGKLPFVLFTMRKPYGERVHLWCGDGLEPAHVAAAGHALAVACWATEVRVFTTVDERPWLVAVDVVRLPPETPARPAPIADRTHHGAGPALRARHEQHASHRTPTPGS